MPKAQSTDLFYVTARRYKPTEGKHFTEPSQTVQGQTKSIQELIDQYRKTGVTDERKPVYLDQEDLEKINKYYRPGSLDFTDIDELKSHVNEMNEIVQKAVTEKERQKLEEEQKAQLRLEFEEERHEKLGFEKNVGEDPTTD